MLTLYRTNLADSAASTALSVSASFAAAVALAVSLQPRQGFSTGIAPQGLRL